MMNQYVSEETNPESMHLQGNSVMTHQQQSRNIAQGKSLTPVTMPGDVENPHVIGLPDLTPARNQRVRPLALENINRYGATAVTTESLRTKAETGIRDQHHNESFRYMSRHGPSVPQIVYDARSRQQVAKNYIRELQNSPRLPEAKQNAFKKRAVSIAVRNKERELESLKFEQDPRKKFNTQVLSVLSTPSNVRMRVNLTVRGGGSVSVPNPRAVSVIPAPPTFATKGKRPEQLASDELFGRSMQESLDCNVALQNRALISKNSLVKSPAGQQRAAERIASLLNEQDAKWTQDRLLEAVNEHYEWLKTKIHAQSVQNQRKRTTVYEFSRLSHFDTIFLKIWRAFLQLNYRKEDLQSSPILTSIIPILPLHIDLAEMCLQLVVRALELLGAAPMTSWLVYKDPTHKKSYVFFDRFRFDFCSLLAGQIAAKELDAVLFEVILRQVYAACTYYDANNNIRVRSYEDIELQLDVVTAQDQDSTSSLGSASPVADKASGRLAVFGNSLVSPGSNADTIKGQDGDTDEELDALMTGENNSLVVTKRDSQSQVDYPDMGSHSPDGRSFRRSEFFSRAFLHKLKRMKRQRVIVQKKKDMKPLETGIKPQKLEDVINLPENSKHIEIMLKFPNCAFNPNGQVEIKPEDLRLRSFLLAQNAHKCCTKGHHPREMNYSIKDPHFVRNGQKAMIMISDHIVQQKRLSRTLQHKPTETNDDRWVARSDAPSPENGTALGPSIVGSPRSPKFGSLDPKPKQKRALRQLDAAAKGSLSIPAPAQEHAAQTSPLSFAAMTPLAAALSPTMPMQTHPSGAMVQAATMTSSGLVSRQSPMDHIFSSGRVSGRQSPNSAMVREEMETIQHRRRMMQDINFRLADPFMADQAVFKAEALMGQANFVADNAKVLKLFQDPASRFRAQGGAGLDQTSDLDSLNRSAVGPHRKESTVTAHRAGEASAGSYQASGFRPVQILPGVISRIQNANKILPGQPINIEANETTELGEAINEEQQALIAAMIDEKGESSVEPTPAPNGFQPISSDSKESSSVSHSKADASLRRGNESTMNQQILEELSHRRSDLAKSRHSQQRQKLLSQGRGVRSRGTHNSDIEGLGAASFAEKTISSNERIKTKARTPARDQTPRTARKGGDSSHEGSAGSSREVGMSGHATSPPDRRKVFSHVGKDGAAPRNALDDLVKRQLDRVSRDGISKQSSLEHVDLDDLKMKHEATMSGHKPGQTDGEAKKYAILDLPQQPNNIFRNEDETDLLTKEVVFGHMKSSESRESAELGLYTHLDADTFLTPATNLQARERLNKYKRFERINHMSKIICGTAQEANNVYAQEIEHIERTFGRKLGFNTADYLREQLLRNKYLQEAKQLEMKAAKGKKQKTQVIPPTEIPTSAKIPDSEQQTAKHTPGTTSIQVAAKKSAHAAPTESKISSQPHRMSDRPNRSHMLSPATEHGPAASAPYEHGVGSPVAKTPAALPNNRAVLEIAEHSSLHPSDEKSVPSREAGQRSANFMVMQKRAAELPQGETAPRVDEMDVIPKPNTAVMAPEVRLARKSQDDSVRAYMTINADASEQSGQHQGMQQLDETIYGRTFGRELAQRLRIEDRQSTSEEKSRLQLEVVGVKQMTPKDELRAFSVKHGKVEHVSFRTRSSAYASRESKELSGKGNKQIVPSPLIRFDIKEAESKRPSTMIHYQQTESAQKSRSRSNRSAKISKGSSKEKAKESVLSKNQAAQQSFGRVSPSGERDRPKNADFIFKNPTIKQASLMQIPQRLSPVEEGSAQNSAMQAPGTKSDDDPTSPVAIRRKDAAEAASREREASVGTLQEDDNEAMRAVSSTSRHVATGLGASGTTEAEVRRRRHQSHLRNFVHARQRKTPTNQVQAAIHRVEPVLADDAQNQRNDSQPSASSNSVWINQYGSKRRMRSVLRGFSPRQSGTNTPITSRQMALGENTDQTISNHNEHARKILRLVQMKGESGDSQGPNNRDLTSVPLSLLSGNMSKGAAQATVSTGRKNQSKASFEASMQENSVKTPRTDEVQETLQRYCDRLEVLNSVKYNTEMHIMNLVPRSSKEAKKIIEDSSVPALNLSMVHKNRDKSQSTERLAMTIRSSLEVSDKAIGHPRRKHSEIAAKNRRKVAQNRLDTNTHVKASQCRRVEEMYKTAEEYQRRQAYMREEIRKVEQTQRMQELLEIKAQVDRQQPTKRDSLRVSQLVQGGELAEDDYELEEDVLNASDAKFAIGPAPAAQGTSPSHYTSRAQPDSHVTLTDIHMRGRSPSPNQPDDSTATIHLQTFIRTEHRQPQASPFVHSDTKHLTLSQQRAFGDRVPAVTQRKLQPLAVKQRSGQHVPAHNFAATVNSSQHMDILSHHTDPIERGLKHYRSGNAKSGSGDTQSAAQTQLVDGNQQQLAEQSFDTSRPAFEELARPRPSSDADQHQQRPNETGEPVRNFIPQLLNYDPSEWQKDLSNARQRTPPKRVPVSSKQVVTGLPIMVPHPLGQQETVNESPSKEDELVSPVHLVPQSDLVSVPSSRLSRKSI